MPRRLAIDFDGTLCDFAYPWIGPIKPGALAALTLFRKLGFYIVIYSCRTCYWDIDIFGGEDGVVGINAKVALDMKAWLDENNVPYDEIDDGTKGKPTAEAYIDDKGVRYQENWPEIAAFIAAREVRA